MRKSMTTGLICIIMLIFSITGYTQDKKPLSDEELKTYADSIMKTDKPMEEQMICILGKALNKSEEEIANQTKAYISAKRNVTPVKLTASKSEQTEISMGAEKEVITSLITVTFWNVGMLMPGYEEATMTSSTKSSLQTKGNSNTSTGIFTGGPNGYFIFDDLGLSVQVKVINGRSVLMTGEALEGESVSLNIDNPGAFADWPDDAEYMNSLMKEMERNNKLRETITNLITAMHENRMTTARNMK